MTQITGRHFPQTPGPTSVPDEVSRAMAAPTIDHRGPEPGRLDTVPAFEAAHRATLWKTMAAVLEKA